MVKTKSDKKYKIKNQDAWIHLQDVIEESINKHLVGYFAESTDLKKEHYMQVVNAFIDESLAHFQESEQVLFKGAVARDLFYMLNAILHKYIELHEWVIAASDDNRIKDMYINPGQINKLKPYVNIVNKITHEIFEPYTKTQA